MYRHVSMCKEMCTTYGEIYGSRERVCFAVICHLLSTYFTRRKNSVQSAQLRYRNITRPLKGPARETTGESTLQTQPMELDCAIHVKSFLFASAWVCNQLLCSPH